MIKEIEVKPIMEILYCNICAGKMHYTGKQILTNPPRYRHKCNNCGTSKNETIIYPNIKYETV